MPEKSTNIEKKLIETKSNEGKKSTFIMKIVHILLKVRCKEKKVMRLKISFNKYRFRKIFTRFPKDRT